MRIIRLRKPRRPRVTLAEQLAKLGFTSKHEYFQSELWTRTRARYMTSEFRKTCFVCENERIKLYHTQYSHLGHEWLKELIPLCQQCFDTIRPKLHGVRQLEAAALAMRKRWKQNH